MYSRSFYPGESSAPPENYNGTTFVEQENVFEVPTEQSSLAEPAFSDINAEECTHPPKESATTGLFGLPFLSGFGKGGSFSFDKLFSDFGTEEILILAVAAFLFFSKDGDSECAILLLLLLFVK